MLWAQLRCGAIAYDYAGNVKIAAAQTTVRESESSVVTWQTRMVQAWRSYYYAQTQLNGSCCVRCRKGRDRQHGLLVLESKIVVESC
jgi:hypothetical protein